jgi:hypothetical protein
MENTCNDNQINRKLIAIKHHKIVPQIITLFNMHLAVQHTIISISEMYLLQLIYVWKIHTKCIQIKEKSLPIETL